MHILKRALSFGGGAIVATAPPLGFALDTSIKKCTQCGQTAIQSYTDVLIFTSEKTPQEFEICRHADMLFRMALGLLRSDHKNYNGVKF